jgi:hypothetical protein
MGKACFPIEIHHQFIKKYVDSMMENGSKKEKWSNWHP